MNGRQRKLPLSRVYGLLEPGPVVLLTTAHRGRANVMTLSWLTMMEFEPPLVGCVVSGRNFSFDLLRRSRACVIAIPTARLAKGPAPAGWTLVFSDEFDAPSALDPTKWGYEIGYVRNQEAQYYTSRSENVSKPRAGTW